MLISINASYVNAADLNSLSQRQLQNVNDKINDAIKQNMAPEDILENLSESDIEVLKRSYSNSYESESMSHGFSEEILNKQEVKIIDNLAKEYYDYYTIHDEFPNSSKNSSSGIISPASAYGADYSEVMKDVGYVITVEEIAKQLVAIGKYIKIGEAFAFLNLVALIVGMGLITFTAMVIAYSAVAVGCNELILTWYTNSASNLLNARTTTAALVVEKQQGTKYWAAYLVNYSGLGGIRVAEPLSIDKAIGKVLANNSYAGVFTYEINLASYLAGQASPIFKYFRDNAHNTGKQIFNLPHFHIYTDANRTHGLTHIWYLGI